MQFFRSTCALLVTLMASQLASAAAFLSLRKSGFGGSETQVAWSNGTPGPCSGFTTIVGSNRNPCGIDFNVDVTNSPFTFEGCGGSGLPLLRDHQFNSNCAFVNTNIPARAAR